MSAPYGVRCPTCGHPHVLEVFRSLHLLHAVEIDLTLDLACPFCRDDEPDRTPGAPLDIPGVDHAMLPSSAQKTLVEAGMWLSPPNPAAISTCALIAAGICEMRKKPREADGIRAFVVDLWTRDGSLDTYDPVADPLDTLIRVDVLRCAGHRDEAASLVDRVLPTLDDTQVVHALLQYERAHLDAESNLSANLPFAILFATDTVVRARLTNVDDATFEAMGVPDARVMLAGFELKDILARESLLKAYETYTDEQRDKAAQEAVDARAARRLERAEEIFAHADVLPAMRAALRNWATPQELLKSGMLDDDLLYDADFETLAERLNTRMINRCPQCGFTFGVAVGVDGARCRHCGWPDVEQPRRRNETEAQRRHRLESLLLLAQQNRAQSRPGRRWPWNRRGEG